MFQVFASYGKLSGIWGCICLVSKYDANATIPLLMMVFEVLNPIVETCASIVARSNDFIEEDNSIFGIGTFMEVFMCICCWGTIFV